MAYIYYKEESNRGTVAEANHERRELRADRVGSRELEKKAAAAFPVTNDAFRLVSVTFG